MKPTYLPLLSLLSSLVLSACALDNLHSRQQIADQLAQRANFQKIDFNTDTFKIAAWKKIQNPTSKSMVIYIEGDGKAWFKRSQISKDPTPMNPLALRLAVQDPRDSILYLSRPCQYIIAQENCRNQYWTSHRYSQTVIDSYQMILDQVKTMYSVQQFELIAYSGGGVIASLLAAQREDIKSITTIASNLDHQSWTNYHHVTPLWGSLSLYPYTQVLSKITQYHLLGADDSNVLPQLNQKLLTRLLKNNNGFYQIYPDYNHSCCWVKNWPKILVKMNNLN